jgi:hypothetical protein
MKSWIGWATGLLTLVGMVYGGIAVLDHEYAKAADTNRRFTAIECQFAFQQLLQIDRDVFTLESVRRTRGLTSFEQARLRELYNHKQELERQRRGC